MKFKEAANIVFGLNPKPVPPGPNNWDEVTSKDFGPEHDFTLQVEDPEGSIWIFNPVSEAALQWCYRHLPDDCPRWGEKGFAIEARYIAEIEDGARRDGLLSRQDYIDSNEEAANQAVQWEE